MGHFGCKCYGLQAWGLGFGVSEFGLSIRGLGWGERLTLRLRMSLFVNDSQVTAGLGGKGGGGGGGCISSDCRGVQSCEAKPKPYSSSWKLRCAGSAFWAGSGFRDRQEDDVDRARWFRVIVRMGLRVWGPVHDSGGRPCF